MQGDGEESQGNKPGRGEPMTMSVSRSDSTPGRALPSEVVFVRKRRTAGLLALLAPVDTGAGSRKGFACDTQHLAWWQEEDATG